MIEYFLVLFLAGQKIEHPDTFPTKEACIEYGQHEITEYRKYHKHSRAWFWCARRYGS